MARQTALMVAMSLLEIVALLDVKQTNSRLLFVSIFNKTNYNNFSVLVIVQFHAYLTLGNVMENQIVQTDQMRLN
jgi:hypothetical protein